MRTLSRNPCRNAVRDIVRPTAIAILRPQLSGSDHAVTSTRPHSRLNRTTNRSLSSASIQPRPQPPNHGRPATPAAFRPLPPGFTGRKRNHAADAPRHDRTPATRCAPPRTRNRTSTSPGARRKTVRTPSLANRREDRPGQRRMMPRPPPPIPRSQETAAAQARTKHGRAIRSCPEDDPGRMRRKSARRRWRGADEKQRGRMGARRRPDAFVRTCRRRRRTDEQPRRLLAQRMQNGLGTFA